MPEYGQQAVNHESTWREYQKQLERLCDAYERADIRQTLLLMSQRLEEVQREMPLPVGSDGPPEVVHAAVLTADSWGFEPDERTARRLTGRHRRWFASWMTGMRTGVS